jgi:hypothetical protein
MGDFDPAHVTPNIDLSEHHSASDVKATLDDLRNRRPAIVIDTAPADIHHWSKVPLESFPELDQYIQAHYTLAATPAGARVYRLSVMP